MEGFLAWMLLNLKLVAASSLGGFISLNFFDNLDAKRRWSVALSGAGLGIFLAPPAVAMSDIAEKIAPTVEIGAGLLIAIFGMSLASAFIKLIRDTNWSEIVKGWIGRKGGSA